MAPPTNISTISESQQDNANPTPRTSRSHLLAGLRTAPKSPGFPSSAPPTEQQFGSQQNRQSMQPSNNYRQGMPQTAVGGSFPNSQRFAMNGNNPMLALPEILAPPSIQFGDEQDNQDMDPEEYAQLLATNQYLAQQQRALEQQLLQLTQAQRQMQNMSLGSGMGQQSQYFQAPNNGFYNQQLQNRMQPIVTPVPGTPGLYTVYNPMTGQQGYVVDNGAQSQSPLTQAPTLHQELSHSPPPTTPAFRAQVSPPPENVAPPRMQSISPPKLSPPKSHSPPSFDVNPLPPPSANAFRRGHARGLSSVTGNVSSASDGPKSGVPKSAVFPPTPMTGTFGPGQNRAGDHPVRQPRGPPSLEELVEKPTSKHEGSKNFVTRQRRRAVNNLVRAGIDRRAASRGSNSIDSVGTPSSECDITFSVSSSDDDNNSVGSRSDGGRPCPSPIGFERKHMKAQSKDTNSTGTPFTTASLSSEDGMVEVKMGERDENPTRCAPLLTFTSAAEKRKTNTF
ncbi:hypothetical protein MMC21_000036 [Puttea exsequens]|nr:hypothetical protein [Puttea exsequens]